MNSKKVNPLLSYTSINQPKFVYSGKQYFDLLLHIITSAQHTIFLQFYIFLNDETGTLIITALKNATARGVKVYLYIDAYASKELPLTCINEMKSAGIKVKLFEPLLSSKHFYFGRRLHHKVVVADGTYSLVGGINVCNRYNDMPNTPAWLDIALYCKGEASTTLENICKEMWNKTTFTWLNDYKIGATPITETNQTTLVRVSRNDWVMRKKEIWNNYLEMFTNANKSITIICSYFLPGNLFRKKLKAAVKRGVKVKIILAGISDILISKHAERYLYDWMLRNNITIYEYKKSVLHAKVAVYDSKWVTIGSYNVNGLSAHASLEINMDVLNENFAAKTENELSSIINLHCKQITKENYSASTNFLRQFWQWVCYNIINKMLFITTFYFKQEK